MHALVLPTILGAVRLQAVGQLEASMVVSVKAKDTATSTGVDSLLQVDLTGECTGIIATHCRGFACCRCMVPLHIAVVCVLLYIAAECQVTVTSDVNMM
jgi:hypothetical protein